MLFFYMPNLKCQDIMEHQKKNEIAKCRETGINTLTIIYV